MHNASCGPQVIYTAFICFVIQSKMLILLSTIITLRFLSKNTSFYSSSLATRRGRAIMMTHAFAFMAEYGPINTMEHNVQEVV